MTQTPEITAFKALAAAGNMRVISHDDNEIHIVVAHGASLSLQRVGAGWGEEIDPDSNWQLLFEFEVRPGRLATDLDELKGKLVAVLIKFAGVIGVVGNPK